MSADNHKKAIFWKTKEFLAGTGTAGIAMVILLLTLIQPMVVDNTYAINENTVEISKTSQTLENIDNSLEKLYGKFETLDSKIDKIELIVCDMSDGKHC